MKNTEQQTVTFYSNRTSTCEYVKLKLEDQIDARGLAVSINEITDLAEISAKGITSLPAVAVDNEYFQLANTDLVAFANATIKYIIENSKPVSVNTIVVPTDFSASAKNALKYAAYLAKQLAAKVQILNVQRVQYAPDLEVDSEKTIELVTKDLLSDEVKLVAELTENTIEIGSELRTGFVAEQVLDYAESIPDSILIMGTTGNSSRMKKYLGSVSTSIAAKSKVPLLLVPPNHDSIEINNILYCAYDEQLDVAVIDEFLQIARATEASINVVNMSKDIPYDELGFLNILKDKYPGDRVSYKAIDHSADKATLLKYADSIEADMIVVSSKHRFGFDNLFHKSFSYGLAIDTEIPLLILHK